MGKKRQRNCNLERKTLSQGNPINFNKPISPKQIKLSLVVRKSVLLLSYLQVVTKIGHAETSIVKNFIIHKKIVIEFRMNILS